MTERTVWNTSLEDQSDAEAVNSILYRLAIALGYPTRDAGDINGETNLMIEPLDADKLLAEAETACKDYYDRLEEP